MEVSRRVENTELIILTYQKKGKLAFFYLFALCFHSIRKSVFRLPLVLEIKPEGTRKKMALSALELSTKPEKVEKGHPGPRLWETRLSPTSYYCLPGLFSDS